MRYNSALLYSLILAGTTAMATGCFGGSSGNGGNGDTDNGTGNGTPDNGADGGGFGPLQGTWQSGCFPMHEGDGYQISTMAFDGAHMTATADIYPAGDNHCTDHLFEATVVYEYEVGETVTTTQGVEAREITTEVAEDPQDIAEAQVEYGIFHIEPSTETLYTGDDGGQAVTDPANVPDNLDFEVPFTRQ